MERKVFLFVLLSVIFGGTNLFWRVRVLFSQTESSTASPIPNTNNTLAWDGRSPNPFTVSLHPLEGYNFKSKEEILSLRTQRVMESPLLLKGSYRPSNKVFGSIIDGKPWWGVDGMILYANGQKSIEGPARESIFIGNPFLLVGLEANWAHKVGHLLALEGPAVDYYPTPLELIYEANERRAHVVYRFSNYFDYLEKIRSSSLPDHQAGLNAYNARDFGFQYLYVDESQSFNVRASTQAVKIQQFLHCGGSCGFPGGCNNMSPTQEGLVVHIDRIPALATIKLFKENPADISQPADFVFVMDIR